MVENQPASLAGVPNDKPLASRSLPDEAVDTLPHITGWRHNYGAQRLQQRYRDEVRSLTLMRNAHRFWSRCWTIDRSQHQSTPFSAHWGGGTLSSSEC
jgi:hypothetical protein